MILKKSIIKVLYRNTVKKANGDVEEKRFFIASVRSDELFRISRIMVNDTMEEKKQSNGSM